MAQEQLAYATKHRTMDTSDYDSADDFILTQRSNSPMYEPLTPPSESEEPEPEPGPGPGPEPEQEAEAHRAQSKSNTSAGSVKRKQLFEVKQVPEDLPELLITDEDLTANQVQVELPEIIITDDEDLTVSHVPMVLPEIVITHDDLPGKPKVSAKQGQPSAKGCNVNQVAEGSGVNNSVQELPGEPGTSEGGRVKRALKRRHLGQPHQSEGVPPVKKSKKQEHEESELAGDAVQQRPDQAQVLIFAKELMEAGERLTQLSHKITENEKSITEKQKIVTRFKQYQSCITEFLEGDVRRYNLPGMADFLKDIKNELMYPYSKTTFATQWGGGRTLNSDTQTDSDSVQSTETEAETLPETQNTVDSVVSYHSDTDDGEGGDVYLEPIRNWERLNNRYRAREMYFEFRFVNLHRARSYHEALAGIHTAIQSLLDTVNRVIGPNDYVQLRLQGDRLNNPLFMVRRNRNELNAEEYLTAISNLLQSYAEISGDDTLRLNVVIVNPPEGGSRRSIMTIPYSSIIERKQQHLIDAHIQGTNLCFAGGVLALMSNSPTLEQIIADAEKMHTDLGWSHQKKVSLTDVSAVEQYLQVKIPVVHWNGTKWGIFKTDEQNYTDTCYMLLYNDHYYGIKNIGGFFGSRNFCQICSTPYSHTHDCMYTCRRCLRKECPKKVGRIHRCPTCKLQCRSKACLTIHEKLASEDKVDCTLRILCSKCDHYVDLNHESKRVCQGKQCRTCYDYFEGDIENHDCYLGKIKQPKLSIRYVFYDCECRQESGVHIPNLIVAKAFKQETVKSVPKKKWKPAGESWEFKGDTCLKDFIRTFTSDLSFKKTHFICHNFRGYDAYLILGGILKERFDVDLITQGGKVICITIKRLGIKFLDSLCHLPMALAKLPKAMGFQEAKGYFPHFFNTEENWEYVGEMPDPIHYGFDRMMPSERSAFLAWYEQNKSNTFDLQKELASYCHQDVNILMQACTKYRHELIEMTLRTVPVRKGKKWVFECVGIDPFQYLTLASVCLKMYRYKFLEEGRIAIPSPDNYHKQCKRFSTPSIQWLAYIEQKEKIDIQHALKGGEFKVVIPRNLRYVEDEAKEYYLDGYAVIEGKKTAFEFNGCFWHGCPQCYDSQAQHPLLAKTYEFLHNGTERKSAVLKKMGFEVRSIWEHEWNNILRTSAEVQSFLAEQQFPESLQPRDALFGGRTGCVSLYYKAKRDEQIHYRDFTSLYPFIMKQREYPLGHPKIIYENFGPLSDYFGLAKVKVYTPRGLFFPVLPVKVDGKLIFPLCMTCATTKQLEECEHTNEQRALTGTWCTVELMEAMARGYNVVKIYEVWHFEKKSDKLFTGYINTFLRQKQEASGFPQWCVSAEDKEKYIRDYHKREGVLLRQDQIDVNPTKRQIAKLFLNSLWGKFAQRTNLPNTSILRDPDMFFHYLFSNKYEVSMCEFIDDDTCCVCWKHTQDRITTSGTTNVFLACFTTAYGRLELYQLLHKLQDRCLYHDTDSVIFVSREGLYNPPLGDFLGELTSELPSDQYITEFVSTGPKSYGYKLSGGETCVKVKGITLNYANNQKINFDTLKDLVFAYTAGEVPPREIVVEQKGIVRNKKQWTLETKTLRKTQRVVFDKRVIVNGFKTVPYGF